MAAVELYADSNFEKKIVETNSDSPNVGDGVNDRVTSIVIIPNDSITSFRRIG